MNDKGVFYAGVFLGGLVGATMGILFAPAPGSETRAQVMGKALDIKDLAAEKAKEKAETAKGACQGLIAGVKEQLPKVQEILDKDYKKVS